MKRRIVQRTVLILSIFAIVIFLLLSSFELNYWNLTNTEKTPHTIDIKGNENFTVYNGVSGGTGTANDPYVITGNEGPIWIEDTTAHFVIRNSLITGIFGGNSLSQCGGLQLNNVTNGLIERCKLQTSSTEDFTLYWLNYCSKIILKDNLIKRFEGFYYCNNITFDSNIVHLGEDESDYADSVINVGHSSDITIINNSMKWGDRPRWGPSPAAVGVYKSRSIDIVDNLILNESCNYSIRGILVTSSIDVDVHGNCLIKNSMQASDNLGIENSWNGSYSIGGNFWSDYSGNDQLQGPFQNITGSDGIGDTPYVIDGNSTDNYPLMVRHLQMRTETPLGGNGIDMIIVILVVLLIASVTIILFLLIQRKKVKSNEISSNEPAQPQRKTVQRKVAINKSSGKKLSPPPSH